MWIFGYGSLVWKADFPYKKKVIGFIKGYERRFWQKSIDHRGVPEKPGRVVTIIPSSDPEARVWGVAYSLLTENSEPNKDAISHLNVREKRYEQSQVLFHPIKTEVEGELIDLIPFFVGVYVGQIDGPLFFKSEDNQEIAIQINSASGPSGSNTDYVLNLCKFMRLHLPHVQDEHLFQIEAELLKLQQNNPS